MGASAKVGNIIISKDGIIGEITSVLSHGNGVEVKTHSRKFHLMPDDLQQDWDDLHDLNPEEMVKRIKKKLGEKAIERVLKGEDLSLVLDEAISVVQTHKPDLSSKISKYDFTGEKKDRYKEADWNWLRKYFGDSKPENLWVEVLVWDLEGKAAHDKFKQVFTPSSLKAANDYAKKLIADGHAKMTQVIGRVSLPHVGIVKKMAADFGTFERDE